MHYPITAEALDYLRKKDKRLGEVIDQLGTLQIPTTANLFEALAYAIVGQQISGKACETIWRRLTELVGAVTPTSILVQLTEALRACGLSERKVEYLQDSAQRIVDGRLDIQALHHLPYQEVVTQLTALRGVGLWTAEMLMISGLHHPDVLSYGDLGIHRGLRMLYRHRTIDRTRWERYRRRYSPYGTTASFYLWAIASGAIPSLTDPAPKR